MATRAEQAARTRRELQDSARRLFAERGYLNTRIADIAAGAGRSIGVFYDHFAGKEALLESLFDEFGEAARRAAGDRATGDWLKSRIAVFWHTCTEQLPVVVALMQASMADREFAARAVRLLGTPVLRDDLVRMREGGATLSGDPDLLASAVSSMLLQFAYVWLAADGQAPGGLPGRARPSDDEAIDTLTALVRHGLTLPQ